MRVPLALLLALGVAGCDWLIGPGDDASAYVKVVDHRGDRLMPDQVVWYYPPSGARYDGEHLAKCLGIGCSRWAVPRHVTGAAYVAASRTRPLQDPYCMRSAYDASPITASADSPPTVTLRLDTRVVTCE